MKFFNNVLRNAVLAALAMSLAATGLRAQQPSSLTNRSLDPLAVARGTDTLQKKKRGEPNKRSASQNRKCFDPPATASGP